MGGAAKKRKAAAKKNKYQQTSQEKRNDTEYDVTEDIDNLVLEEPSFDEENGGDDSFACTHYQSVHFGRFKSFASSQLQCSDCNGAPQGKGKKKGNARGKNVQKQTDIKLLCICMLCGRVGCNRSAFGHAIKHHESNQKHCLAFIPSSTSVWCYACDSYVPVHETAKKHQALRDCVNFYLIQTSKNSIDSSSFQHQPTVKLRKGKQAYTPPASESRTTAVVSTSGVKQLIQQTLNEPGEGLRGLDNLGNTCFFNSVMQNLTQLEVLRGACFNLNLPAQEGLLTLRLREFMACMWKAKTTGIYSPQELFNAVIKHAPKFKGYQQQDAHELLTYLLDGIRSEELTRIQKTTPKSTNNATTPTNLASSAITVEATITTESQVVPTKGNNTELVDEDTSNPSSGIADNNVELANNLSVPTEACCDTSAPPTSELDDTLKEMVTEQSSMKESSLSSEFLLESKEAESSVGSHKPIHNENIADSEATTANQIASETTVNDPVEEETTSKSAQDLIGDKKSIEHADNNDNNTQTRIPQQQRATTFIDDIFGGKLISCITCHQCQSLSTVHEPFHQLLLSIPGKRAPTVAAPPVQHLSKRQQKLLQKKTRAKPTPKPAPTNTPTPAASVTTSELQVPVTDSIIESAKSESEHAENNQETTVPSTSSESDPVVTDVTLATPPNGLGDASTSLASEPTNTDDKESTTLVQTSNNEHETENNVNKDSESKEVEIKSNNEKNNENSEEEQQEEEEEDIVATPKVIDLRNGINSLHLDKISLERCLSEFTAPELLEGNNAYRCMTCTKKKYIDIKRKLNEMNGIYDGDEEDTFDEKAIHSKNLVSVTATKQFLLCDAPDVLTVALKRFAQVVTGKKVQCRKVDTKVDFPLTLDMTPFMFNTDKSHPTKYRLSGISVHGGGLGGGHYVAYVRQAAPLAEDSLLSEHESKWYYFSDSTKRVVNVSEVLQSEAYILFYKKCK